MKILELQAENFLNLRAVSIHPDGRVITITGKNGAGKSNILNAMFYALAGKKGHAPEPIRRGTQRATVKLMLGNTEVEMVVVLRITPSGPSLDVETPAGQQWKKPQTVLDALIGQFTFDPAAFPRMKPAERLEVLRGLVKLDVDADALDAANERDRVLRADWNRRVATFKERVATVADGVDATMDVALDDVSALTQRMAEATTHNAAIQAEVQRRQHREMRATDMNASAGQYYERARELRCLAEAAQADGDRIAKEALALMNAADADAPLAEPIDVSVVRVQIDEAMKSNSVKEQQLRTRQQHEAAVRELEAASAMSASLTAAMEARTEEKRAAVERAQMPIVGLGFGNGDVTFNGLPFEQSSTGEQLRVSTAIGMALNPKLRVLCVRDGSLLDEESRSMLADMAEEHDFQLWIEATQDRPTVGIHIVDGSIAAIDGESIDDADAMIDADAATPAAV